MIASHMFAAGRRLGGAALLAALLLWQSGLPGLELRGRLVDGTAMLRQPGAFSAIDEKGFTDAVERVPIAREAFTLHAPRGGRTWTGTTDAEGRFVIALDGAAAGAEIVASVRAAGSAFAGYHSLAAPIAEGAETEFRLYRTTDDASFLRTSQYGVLCTLADPVEGAPRRARFQSTLMLSNASGDLYVGRAFDRKSGGIQRAVYRILLPEGAEVVRNESDRGGAPWTITPDGWALLDSPVPPYPEAPMGVRYDLHYTVPASQTMVLPQVVDLPLTQLTVLGVAKHFDFAELEPGDGPVLKKFGKMPLPDPETREQVEWVVLQGRNVPAGVALPAVATIDSLELGQVNSRSLRVVLAFVIGGLLALFAGVVLGRRGPRVETVLAGASGEEILERIAQLDAQNERGLVRPEAYRAQRERLLSLARHEVPELAAATRSSGDGSDDAAAESSMPARARDLLGRIRELAGATTPGQIQERLVLLEELVRILDAQGEKAETTSKRKPGERS